MPSLNNDTNNDAATILAHDGFRAAVLSPAFACVAGAAAVRAGNYRFSCFAELGEAESVKELATGLREFIAEFPLSPDLLTTYVASFNEPGHVSPVEFETLLWATLQGLHDLDATPWDPTVSRDPQDSAFSFSFHGRSFFIVGMHPGSDRWTRRLAFPALVFNAHAQFEELRRTGRYAPLQRTIRRREERLQGSYNPALDDHGNQSEAKQYSGRMVEDGWRCPFETRNT